MIGKSFITTIQKEEKAWFHSGQTVDNALES